MNDRELMQPVCRYISEVLATGTDNERIVARTIMHLLPLDAALAAPVAPSFVPSPECDSPRICSTAKVCAGLFGTKQQCGAPVAPASRYTPPALWAALQFYAQRQHFVLADSDAWDTVSGEPANFWEDEANTATVEDGSIARIALEGLESMPTQAAVDVLAERRRHIEVEGWTPEHDDRHRHDSMSIAAACYALNDTGSRIVNAGWLWQWTGWADSWFKPRDKRSNLVRAGALILAEIERLDRAAAHGIKP
jgi:hypothetical protein